MRIRLSAAVAAALSSVLAVQPVSSQAAPAQPGESSAPPAASGPKFNIMGPSNCSGWPKSGSISSASKAVPLNWALGFVSGQAVKSNLGLLDAVEPEAMDKWLTDYCRDHPNDTLPAAVGALQSELEAKVAASAPAQPPEPPMFYTPPVQTAAKPPAPAARKPAAKARTAKRAAARTPAAKPAARKPAAQTAKAGG